MRVGANVYLRGDGRWEARYQKGVDENDRIIYGYVYGKTQEETLRKRAEKIREMGGEWDSSSLLASKNPEVTAMPNITDWKKTGRVRRIPFRQAFDERMTENVRTALVEQDTPASTAFLFSLLLGLSLGEITTLRYGDVDLDYGLVHISRSTVIKDRKLSVGAVEPRTVPITRELMSILAQRRVAEGQPNHYIMTDTASHVESNRVVESGFRKLLKPFLSVAGMSAESLRSCFVVRALKANLNVETVAALLGVERASIYHYFGKYIQPHLEDIRRLDQEYEETPRHLNLLILGAGSHGHGVREIAKLSGVFGKIMFLDDQATGPDIIGTCAEYLTFLRDFPVAFPAFGNNELRQLWTERLRKSGFLLPRLIHPSAIVSDHAEIGEGSIIMAQATVDAGVKIGDACIVAPNSMVGFGSQIGSYSHLDSGSIVGKDNKVPEKTTVETGSVYKL